MKSGTAEKTEMWIMQYRPTVSIELQQKYITIVTEAIHEVDKYKVFPLLLIYLNFEMVTTKIQMDDIRQT